MLNLRGTTSLELKLTSLEVLESKSFTGTHSGPLLPLEVVVVVTKLPLSRSDLKAVLAERLNGAPRTVMVCNESQGKAQLFGPTDDRAPITVTLTVAERVLQNALSDSSVSSARRGLVEFLDPTE